jgi:peroxiredoxin
MLWGVGHCLAAEPAVGTSGSLPIVDPAIWLVRSPNVQRELQMNVEQQRRTEQLLQRIDPRLWTLRDLSPDQQSGAEQWRRLLGEFNRDLASVLQPSQQRRLQQLVVQAWGVQAFRQADFARQLQVADAQQQQIQQVLEETAEQVRGLQKSSAEDQPALQQQITQIRTDEQQRILTLITPDQRARWIELRGDLFDLANVQWTGIYAPELKQADQWINSAPLTLESLRGRVVALQFWTFGCINCIRNYPAYQAWHEQYSSRGLTLIGIHTPETEGEKDIQRVRQNAIDHDLRFPIAVDNHLLNWQAWANRIWPSVYLIDKQGRIRYWWYGELNWQQAEGEKWMRQRIEELLAE